MIAVAAFLIACLWGALAYFPVLVVEGMILAARLNEPVRSMLALSAKMNALSLLSALLVLATGILMLPSIAQTGVLSPTACWYSLLFVTFCTILVTEIKYLNRRHKWDRRQVFKACLAANLVTSLLFAAVAASYAKTVPGSYTVDKSYIGSKKGDPAVFHPYSGTPAERAG